MYKLKFTADYNIHYKHQIVNYLDHQEIVGNLFSPS